MNPVKNVLLYYRTSRQNEHFVSEKIEKESPSFLINNKQARMNSIQSTTRVRFAITGEELEKLDEIRVRELLRTNEAYRFYTDKAPNRGDRYRYSGGPHHEGGLVGWDGHNPSPSEMLNSYNKMEEYRSEITEEVTEEVNNIMKKLWSETDEHIMNRVKMQNSGNDGWSYPHCPDKYNLGLYGAAGSTNLRWKSIVYKSMYENLMSKQYKEWYDYWHLVLAVS